MGKINKHLFPSYSFLLLPLLFILHCNITHSQLSPSLPPIPQSPLLPTPPSTAALPPSPPQPSALSPLPLVSFAPSPLSSAPLSPAPTTPAINITAILDKPGRFTSLIRLLKTTQVDDRIATLLSESKQGLTLLAPTDSAFSALKSGTLNSLSVQQQVQVVLFHILTSYFPISEFQSASNPLRTLAGDNGGSDYPLNVTTTGSDRVNLTSGLVNAEVGKTIYTDGQLAVYQVDKVLLPPKIFASAAPAMAPSKASKGGAGDTSSDSSDGGATVNAYSGAVALGLSRAIACMGGLLTLAAFALF